MNVVHVKNGSIRLSSVVCAIERAKFAIFSVRHVMCGFVRHDLSHWADGYITHSRSDIGPDQVHVTARALARGDMFPRLSDYYSRLEHVQAYVRALSAGATHACVRAEPHCLSQRMRALCSTRRTMQVKVNAEELSNAHLHLAFSMTRSLNRSLTRGPRLPAAAAAARAMRPSCVQTPS